MAKKTSTSKAGGHLHHDRSEYEKMKSRPVISIGSTYQVVDEGIGKQDSMISTMEQLNNCFAVQINESCSSLESFLYVVAGCKAYLDQGYFTWWHSSALSFIAQTLQSIKSAKLNVDLSGYLPLCTITGDSLHPDTHLSTTDNVLYVIELTVGFETNLKNAFHHKKLKYHPLLTDLAKGHKR